MRWRERAAKGGVFIHAMDGAGRGRGIPRFNFSIEGCHEGVMACAPGRAMGAFGVVTAGQSWVVR